MENINCPLCGQRDPVFLWEKHGARYERCAECGLVYENPRFTPEELKAFYSDQSYFINEGAGKDASGYTNYFTQFTSALANEYFQILHTAAPATGGKVSLLDIGCGPGNLLSIANDRGWSATGLEISHWAVETGRKSGLTIIENSLEDARFPDASFDVISMFDVLEHLSEPKGYIAEIFRILRPGGVVVAETPNINGFFARYLYGPKADMIKPRAHICLYSPATIRRLFGLAPFAELTVKAFPYSRRITPGSIKRLLTSRLGKGADPVQFTINDSLRILARKRG